MGKFNAKRFKKVITQQRLTAVLSGTPGYQLGRHDQLRGMKVVVRDGEIVAQARTWAECATQLGVRI